MAHRSEVPKALMVGILFLLSFSSVLAQERWETGERVLENFVCQHHGVSRLTVAGVVTLSHPSEPGYQVPPSQGRTILIKCDDIEFLESSRLESVSNLRIIVDRALNGAVHVKSLRGQPGFDAVIDRELARSRKAASGVNGINGLDGSNADLTSDGTLGQRGGDGGGGATGQPGVQGPPGSPGFDGSHIQIVAFSVGSETTVMLETLGGPGGNGGRGGRGQDGGDGGAGGRGGKGGDASLTHDAERGGDGGNGGDGGDGGNGGSGGTGGRGGAGGDVFFYVAEGGGRPQDLKFRTDGGDGGYPGIGGPPGKGGKGGAFGHAGGGGYPQDCFFVPVDCLFEEIPILDVIAEIPNVITGEVLEVKWHGHGHPGNRGKYGEPGENGRPGPIGTWGESGARGNTGEWKMGNVSIKDFITYSDSHGGS